MSKTPYELRYELLLMAQNILTENLMNERIRLENDWNTLKELAIAAAERGVQSSVPAFPVINMLNPEDIIKLAGRLNEFVSNTGE